MFPYVILLMCQEVLDWIAAESSGDHTIEIVTDNMLDQVIVTKILFRLHNINITSYHLGLVRIIL